MMALASNADRAKYVLCTSSSARLHNHQTITIYIEGGAGQFYFGDLSRKLGQLSIGVDNDARTTSLDAVHSSGELGHIGEMVDAQARADYKELETDFE